MLKTILSSDEFNKWRRIVIVVPSKPLQTQLQSVMKDNNITEFTVISESDLEAYAEEQIDLYVIDEAD